MIHRSKTRNLRYLDHLHPRPQCQRTKDPAEKCWTAPSAAKRPKPFKQEYPADTRNDGQEQGNLTHSGPLSILKNPLN